MSQEKWMDISYKLKAKIENGILYLYYNQQEVAQIKLSPSYVTMNDGFRLENGKILAKYQADQIHTQYAEEGCDLDWCQ